MNRVRSKRTQQLESTAQQIGVTKQTPLATPQIRGSDAPIVVLDDDDDDVIISSPRSFAVARNGQSNRNGRVPVIGEDELELRLGPTKQLLPFSLKIFELAGRANSGDTHHRRNGRSPPTMTVVLCDDVGETDHNVSKKRKAVQSLKTVVPAQESKEIKLTCAICMNAMEQETSTVCGHIFCKSCITSAIQLQKKCPTCRRKLTMSNIHRIYLSSA